MNLLISQKYRCLLYKDEIGSLFLITKHMEIYKYSEDIVGCYCWNKRIYLQLKKKGIIAGSSRRKPIR